MASTTPPTSCGIATFAAALAGGLRQLGAEMTVVDTGPVLVAGSEAVCALGSADPDEIEHVASALGRCDAIVVQHEYGIYPGLDGSSVVELVRQLSLPVIVVAHTVLAVPSPRQRAILTELCAAADVVVVMTEVALERLVHHYGISRHHVVVISHGAAVNVAHNDVAGTAASAPLLLTWGLLGPGKGIEWAIDAFAQLDVTGPAPTYLVAGATHPNAKAQHGESYRNSLIHRAARLGVADRVMFDDTYRSVADLTALISTADLVVLPYDSVDQVTSGVLVDAVAAGRPVVSTAFPHAVELLASGAGLVVPQSDSNALCDAIQLVLDYPHRASQMADEARRLAPSLSWPAIAARYVDTARQLRRTRTRLAS